MRSTVHHRDSFRRPAQRRIKPRKEPSSRTLAPSGHQAPSPARPDSFPRRILLAVTGLSPQVVTETVYALTRIEPAFVPTEVHLLTTGEGAERAKLTLLSEKPGWFHR